MDLMFYNAESFTGGEDLLLDWDVAKVDNMVRPPLIHVLHAPPPSLLFFHYFSFVSGFLGSYAPVGVIIHPEYVNGKMFKSGARSDNFLLEPRGAGKDVSRRP